MRKMFCMRAHELEHGPHFNEVYAIKAVSHMENEDGTHGPHWSIDETTAVASQYGISFTSKFNKYDWYVALNMVYSDFCNALASNANPTKCYVELAKSWLNDKDVEEGKMWYYYKYIMLDEFREDEEYMESYTYNNYKRKYDYDSYEHEEIPRRSYMSDRRVIRY